MRVRAANEAGMQHARQLDVIDIPTVPAEKAFELRRGIRAPMPVR